MIEVAKEFKEWCVSHGRDCSLPLLQVYLEHNYADLVSNVWEIFDLISYGS